MKSTMQALVLEAKGNLVLKEVPRPSPAAGEALIRVKAAGICGSDLPRVFGDIAYFYPLIPGHEFAGEVVEVGDVENKGWRGKRVTVYPLIACGECAYCQLGWFELCENYGYVGSRRNGAWAELVTAPIANLVELPASVSFEEGALTEPAAVALHGVRKSGIRVGEEAAVFGLGPIGILVGIWLKKAGVRFLLGLDVDQSKFKKAKEFGFDQTVNPQTKLPARFPVVIEASGNRLAILDAIELVEKRGTLLLLGNQEREVVLSPQDMGKILRKELRLQGSWNSQFSTLGSDWTAVLGMEAKKTVSLQPLVSHRLSLSQTPDFIFKMWKRQVSFYKAIITDFS
ncbi:MAG: L-iditol 2-dehydrogenase [Candidatus Atribacteria bacterium]|nr:L-iditol 2-dehydrogenase [Candidatus Atribacteria bacterium]